MDLAPDERLVPERATGAPDAAESKADLRTYWRIISKRWPVVALSLAVVLAAAIVWTYRQPKVYEGRAQIIIEPTAPQVLQGVKDVVEMGTSSYWSAKEFYETQYKIIQSIGVARRAAEKLGLQYDPDYNGGNAQKPDMEAIARRLASQVQAKPVKDSRLAEVTVTDLRPERAAQLANTVAETYIEYNLDFKLEGARTATAWLNEQETALRQKLEEAELKLYDFRKNRNLLDTSVDDRLSMVAASLQTQNTKLNEVRVSRLELESRRKRIQAAGDKFETKETIPEVTGNSYVQAQHQRYVAALSDYVDLSARYGPEHPKIIAAKSHVDELRRSYSTEIDKVLSSFENRYQAEVETEKSLTALLEKTKKEAIELAKIEVEYRPFTRTAQETAKVYSLVAQRQKEINLTELMRTNNVRVLERAIVPGAPIRPKPIQNLAIALVLGLSAGIALAFGIEALDNTLKSQVDVEALLGVPVLGLIPIITPKHQDGKDDTKDDVDRHRDLGVLREPKSLAAECCRSIRTNILFMSPDHPIRTMVVTSPSPQEGKTTTAANLAITMAEAGGRVLIVDTDLRRPRLHKSFGVPNQAGVSTVVVGETTLDEAIKRSEMANLDILTCGPVPPNPAELLHTERFAKMLEALKQRYDRIILDSPPTAAVTDPVILGAIADGVILVVKGGRTTRDAARHSQRQLVSANARLLGVIVNEIDFSNPAYGYQYYYYRNYSRYGYQYGDRGIEGKSA
jgi:capsular exopolysaccharide synthesis family protein